MCQRGFILVTKLEIEFIAKSLSTCYYLCVLFVATCLSMIFESLFDAVEHRTLSMSVDLYLARATSYPVAIQLCIRESFNSTYTCQKIRR
jgi:hypothetical protein